MNNEYDKALDTVNAATKEYNKVRDDYRARKVGDAVYLAARAKFVEAQEAFDVAYAKAAGWKKGS